MKKLLVIIVIFIGVRELIVVSRNFVDNRVAEQNIEPEKIDLENVHIGFDSIEWQIKDHITHCSSSLYVKNDKGTDITIHIGVFNPSLKKEPLSASKEKIYAHIRLIPNPKKYADLHFGDLVKDILQRAVGFGYEPEIAWLKMEEEFFYEWEDIPLTQKNTSLLDKIMIDEKPFVVGFTWLTFEEKSGFGMTWWHIAKKQPFAFEINPKGLIKPEDKEKYLTCKNLLLNKK